MLSSAVRRVTGYSEVEEKNGRIIISGVAAEYLSRDMKRIWSTSKVASAMFLKVTWGEVVIPSFFALEFDYILRRMLTTRGLDTSKRVIRNIIEGLNANTWLASISMDREGMLDRKAFTGAFVFPDLLRHQHMFLNRYEECVPKYGLKGYLLSAAPGAGKSISGCALALAVHSDVVIIVCPKVATQRVWQKTLNKEFKEPQYPYIAELDGDIQPKKKWHIFHYEALERALELADVLRDKKITIILDESHNFNEIKSLRTERFLQLCIRTRSQNILWASGTPVKAMGFECIPLLKSIDPLFTEETELAFRKMYGRDAKRTLDILAYRLGLISHTVPKSEFMPDEPEQEEIRVKIPNGKQYTLGHLAGVMSTFIEERTEYYRKNRDYYQRIYDAAIDVHRKTLKTPAQQAEFKIYQSTVNYLVRNGFNFGDGDKAILTNKYEKDRIHPTLPQEMRKPFIDAKSVIKYPILKVRGECLGRILTKERIQCHIDMLNYIDFERLINGVKKKTIVFTSYVKVVDAVTQTLKSKGFKPTVVYGDTNKDLASIVNTFEKDPSVNPLVATFDSLSTAMPLTMANGVIFLNNPWRSFEKEQAIARAHRIGQDETVYCFDIILDTGQEPNISSRSLDVMQWSKDQVDRIMGVNGDIGVSLESNGFVVGETLDINDVLDDVCWDHRRVVKNVVSSEEARIYNEEIAMESFNLYPSNYNFYSQKNKA